MVISRLDYCNALLTGLPACAVKPLQMVQNAAACLVINKPLTAHITPLFIELHWLPLAAGIKFKALMLAYKVLNGTAPILLECSCKGLCHDLVTAVAKGLSSSSAYTTLKTIHSFHVSFHDGGMTYRALPELGRPHLSSRNS